MSSVSDEPVIIMAGNKAISESFRWLCVATVARLN